METQNFDHSNIFRFDASVEYATNSVVSKTLVKKDIGTITLFSFDKGQALSEHSAPYDALIQVMEGSAEIFINKQKHVLKTGESIIMPANIPHAVNAAERFKMLLTMIRG